MPTDAYEEFQRRFNLARNGGGILFCGAGFSADCLNFRPEETLGTGAQLLQLFNAVLRPDGPFRDLKNAADALWQKIGDHGMLELLKERFTVSNVTSDMTDLLRYPWDVIYTTNYDNALEIAAQAAQVRVESLNNTDEGGPTRRDMRVIHLHGYVQKWDIRNIRESCVLGAESYSSLTHVKKWLTQFRQDIDQAQIVVFVGFNAGDFHLNQAIYDLTGLREKSFFINRPTARTDPDITAAQKRLGTPFFTGRAGFAATIRGLLAKEAPKEPRIASFVKYAPPNPSLTVPTQAQIEDLFLYGKAEPSQLARDIANNVSEYHVVRGAVHEILDAIAVATRIVLLEGYPCDGKSLLAADLAYRLSGTRPVYQMRQAYENVLNEVADILHHAPNAALIIENCFDLPLERLSSIARQFDGQSGVLILTSRSVAADASVANLAMLQNLSSFRRVPLARLTDNEASVLSDLADQIAGWREFGELGHDARLRFIQRTCEASLPHFLLRLLESDYVISRYQEEFNKLSLSRFERSAIIAALYCAHIGENAPVSFLSNALSADFGSIIDGLNERLGESSFILVRRNGGIVETVPSIGAKNILKNLFGDFEIVDALVPVIKNLSVNNRNPFEDRMFRQFMRFSILSDVVSDKSEINRFFEHNKQELQIRRRPLFWLQWHMAKCAELKLVDAEKFLEQGYSEAKDIERRTGQKFDFRQLDDRRAKFLMLRAEKSNRAEAELFRDFKEAVDLTGKILRQNDPQHYPFETLAEIRRTFGVVGHRLDQGLMGLIEKWLDQLKNEAKKRIGLLPAGYQMDKARAALDSL